MDLLIWLRERGFAFGEMVCTAAAARGDLPMLQFAREHGCPFDSDEVMAMAALNGHLNILEWGVQQGCELTEVLTGEAAAGGSIPVLEWLWARNSLWDFDLVHAFAHGHYDIYRWLKARGFLVEVNEPDPDGRTCLHCAASDGQTQVVRLLLADGAHVNPLMDGHILPVHLAVDQGHCEIVQLLVNAGAWLDVKKWSCPRLLENSTTPLLMAAEKNLVDVVRVLLRAGANTEVSGQYGELPLTLAAKKNHVVVVRALLEAGASHGVVPLAASAEEGHLDIVNMLLAAGANPNKDSADCRYPLYLACKLGHTEVIRALIHGGADVNLPRISFHHYRYGASDWRPIHVAAFEGHANVVVILMKCGADINASTSKGHTPLYLANAEKHMSVVEILTSAGATLGFPQCE